MKVRELKELLENREDDSEVWVASDDPSGHKRISFPLARVESTTVCGTSDYGLRSTRVVLVAALPEKGEST